MDGRRYTEEEGSTEGFGADGLRPLFSPPDPYSPPHSWNTFGDHQSRHPSASAPGPRPSLDLYSGSDEWPHLDDYSSFLQGTRFGASADKDSGAGGSAGGGTGGSAYLPPNPSRSSGGGRTLGLHAPCGAVSSGRRGRGCGSPVRGGGRGSPVRGRSPVPGSSLVKGKGVVRPRDEDTMDSEDCEEIDAAGQLAEVEASDHAEVLMLHDDSSDSDSAEDEMVAMILHRRRRRKEREVMMLLYGYDTVNADAEEQTTYYEFETCIHTPQSSGTHKRPSSTSTIGTSPIKKGKSPVVKMMKEFLSSSSKREENENQLLERLASARISAAVAKFEAAKKQKEEREAQIHHAQQLALEAGVHDSSLEYYALSLIVADDWRRPFFYNLQNPEARRAYLKNFCKEKKLL